jgi:hypothetical protein
MSDDTRPINPDGSPPLPPPLPPERSGCLTALMVTIGIILLLPGLCALLFGLGTPGTLISLHPDPVVLLGVLVGCLGVVLIWYAARRQQK